MATTAYKEYLGDIEDPYPIMTYTKEMKTVIGAPEFPKAIAASIVSGDISIPIMLRRLPCLEYGKIVFGNVSKGHSFNFRIVICNNFENTTFNITKVSDGDLEVQLLFEKLIYSIRTTRKVAIFIGEDELMNSTINEAELTADMFTIAPTIIRYIESLLIIQRHTGCSFLPEISEVSNNEYMNAIYMASSLQGKWNLSKLDFDNEVRCDYDHIPTDLFDKQSSPFMLTAEMKVHSIYLQGVEFSAAKYIIIYTDAKINNFQSVKRNIRRKKNSILFTIKPIDGKTAFNKYVRFEGITVKKLT